MAVVEVMIVVMGRMRKMVAVLETDHIHYLTTAPLSVSAYQGV